MSGEPVVRGVLDTSVFIASESRRHIRTELLPVEGFTTVVTVAELTAGVLIAADAATRARRLRTLTSLSSIEVLDVDRSAAEHWARLRVHLAESGRRMNVNDLWIAAIAVSRGFSVVTQDADFEALSDFDGFSLIRV